MTTKQVQYVELVGPIWVPSVAASMAWLPDMNPAAQRGLAPRRVVPAVQNVFPIASTYNPALLDWTPRGRAPLYSVRPNKPSSFSVQPFFEALYKSEGLQWVPRAQQPARKLSPNSMGSTILDPIPPVNPAQLSWAARGQSVIVLPKQPVKPSQSVIEPFTITAYDPRTLEWVPSGEQPARGLVQGRSVRTVSPFIPALYDPALLQWVPSFQRPVPVIPPNRVMSHVLFPFSPNVPIYIPSGMEWLPFGRYPVHSLPPNRVLGSLLDPLPLPPIPSHWTAGGSFSSTWTAGTPAISSWTEQGGLANSWTPENPLP